MTGRPAGRVRRLLSPVSIIMALLMAGATGVRLPWFNETAYLTQDPRYPFSDAWIWMIWSKLIWQHGLNNIQVVTPRTYLGYHYVFWAIGQVYGRISPDYKISRTLLYLVKLPPVICDLLLAPLILMATRRVAALVPEALISARRLPLVGALEQRGLSVEDTLGLAAAAIFLFSPAVIYDSAVWAQSESVISVFMLAAILLLVSGRVGWAWTLWAVAFVIKPQPLVIIPALIAYTYWRFGRAGVARALAGAGAGGFAMLAYFIFTGNGGYIIDVYRVLFSTHDDQISINAWNLWWIGYLHGLRASDTLVPLGVADLTMKGASFLLLAGTTLATLSYLHVRRDLAGLLVSCAMLNFAFYLFPISTHERYLYPFFIFLAPVVLLERRWLIVYVPLSAMFFLNIFFACPSDPDLLGTYLRSNFGEVLAVANVAAFFVTLSLLVGSAAHTHLRVRRLRLQPPARTSATR